MCSVGCDIEETKCLSEVLPSEKTALKKCRRCDDAAVLLLQKKDPFCEPCFFKYCEHKFRTTIGKSKFIKQGDKVLLCCSGGMNSMAMLQMTRQALKSPTPKKLGFNPGVLYINEETEPENESTLAILSCLKSAGLTILYSSIEMACRTQLCKEFYWTWDESLMFKTKELCGLREKLNRSIESIKSLSARQDYFKRLRLQLSIDIALNSGYHCIFLGNSVTNLAVEIMCNTALGRGSQIYSESSFLDTRYDVPICRPMREFLSKEIALYNYFNNHLYSVKPNLLTKSNVSASIQRLTENFVLMLQSTFPATVFTIVRTGSKLSEFKGMPDNSSCVLCKSPLDNNLGNCSALEALHISAKFSNVNSKQCDANQVLCHGCYGIVKQTSDQQDFYQMHGNILPGIKLKMKEEIKSYLLTEDGSEPIS